MRNLSNGLIDELHSTEIDLKSPSTILAIRNDEYKNIDKINSTKIKRLG